MAAAAPDRRTLWLGAPGGDDSKRSADEVRLIREMAVQEVDIFITSNNIDDAASRELAREQLHVQLAVLERGPLRACTNPSGALVARIRDAKRGVLSGNNSRYGSAPLLTIDANSSELDRFLVESRIDQAGVASFRSETAEVQRAVMARGPLVNTTNPSASLMARIRTVKQDMANGGTGMPPPGSGPPGGLGALGGLGGLLGGGPPAPRSGASRVVPRAMDPGFLLSGRSESGPGLVAKGSPTRNVASEDLRMESLGMKFGHP